MGFIGAGYLINRSYSDWRQAPISTTLSTKPISDLPFPTVTVCPPKGSHTALNYDLMMADNNSLTKQDRDNLKEAVYDIFIEASHQEFIRLMQVACGGNPLLQDNVWLKTQDQPMYSYDLSLVARQTL